jgi:endonuclease YncB( thermonuclease family)
MRIVTVLACTFVLCAGAHAQQARSVGDTVSGPVGRVVGGDTFDIAGDIGRERIRIWGIGVPNWRTRCVIGGKRWRVSGASQAALRDCLRGTVVSCRVQKVERRWGKRRLASECLRDSDNEDVGACMVGSGWAIDRTSTSGGRYASLEARPKSLPRGLWRCQGGPPVQR